MYTNSAWKYKANRPSPRSQRQQKNSSTLLWETIRYQQERDETGQETEKLSTLVLLRPDLIISERYIFYVIYLFFIMTKVSWRTLQYAWIIFIHYAFLCVYHRSNYVKFSGGNSLIMHDRFSTWFVKNAANTISARCINLSHYVKTVTTDSDFSNSKIPIQIFLCNWLK